MRGSLPLSFGLLFVPAVFRKLQGRCSLLSAAAAAAAGCPATSRRPSTPHHKPSSPAVVSNLRSITIHDSGRMILRKDTRTTKSSSGRNRPTMPPKRRQRQSTAAISLVQAVYEAWSTAGAVEIVRESADLPHERCRRCPSKKKRGVSFDETSANFGT